MAMVFHSKVDDADEWDREMKALIPDLDYRVWPDVGNVEDIDIALVWQAPPGMLASLTGLKLILSLGAGVDHLLDDPDLPDVPITRLIDSYCTSAMSEYVLLQVMRFHRDDPLYQTQQRRAEYIFHQAAIASHRRVGIMGLGSLGGAAARMLAVTGFDVRGWSRRQKDIEGVQSFCGPEELDGFLGGCEILVCLLALTDETKSILNAETMGKLPPGACVVNAARGDHLVEEDLITLLDSGHLGGAALDCFLNEPLEETSPLWSHPKIFLTPHSATGTHAPSAARHVAENIRRFYAGEPLLNELDKTVGY